MSFEDVNLNLLRTLDALIRTRSVTRAARRLGVGQPAVSKQLAALRSILGDEVIRRVGAESILSPRAEELAPRVRDALHVARQVFAPEEALDLCAITGEFSIGMGDGTLAALGGPLVAHVRRRSSRLVIHARSFGRGGFRELDLGELDLAIVHDIRGMPWLREEHEKVERFVLRRAFDEPWVVYSADAVERWTIEAYLAREHVLPRSLGENNTGLVDLMLRSAGRARRVVATAPSFSVAAEIAAACGALLTGPASYRISAGARLRAAPVPPELNLGTREMVLMWSPAESTSARHKVLRRAVLEALDELVGGCAPS